MVVAPILAPLVCADIELDLIALCSSLLKFRPLLLLIALTGVLALSAPNQVKAQIIPGLPSTSSSETAADPSSIKLLIDVLKDDTARQKLIEELEANADGTATGSAEAATSKPSVGLGTQIAEFTQSTAESAAQSARSLWEEIAKAPQFFGSLAGGDYLGLGAQLLQVGVLIILTYALFFLLRYLTNGFRAMLGRRAAAGGWIAKIVAVVTLLVTNIVLVVLAWGAGTVMAISVLGQSGQVVFAHSLFLNAFLVVEVFQAVVRAILAPRQPGLRTLSLSDVQARMLTKWLRVTVSIVVFCQLLLVPIFNRQVSNVAGQAVSALGYLIVLALLFNLVLRVREPVSDWMTRHTKALDSDFQRLMVRSWHVPVLTYLIILFAVVMLWPADVMMAMLLATAKIIVAVVLGLIVASLLNRMILNGVKLPANLSDRVPLLEKRLNAFVPRALTFLRLLVLAAVTAATLDAIGLFSLGAWFESDVGAGFASSLATVIVMALIAFGAWLIISSWVDYRLQDGPNSKVKARERTLLVLLRNALSITIAVMSSMFILSEIGIDIAPLLASAGVIGLAIGFGAQKLVQDIITGIFIQLEGAIDVGDVVSIAGISGSVERLTIRSASLRDVEGVYHIVPFSSVDTVSNFMRGFAYALCDMGVAYREDMSEVKKAMFDAFEELKTNPEVAPNLASPELEWMGINEFGDNAVVARTRIMTLPGKQWATRRAYNDILKTVFDARGIEIPFPHQTIYFGEDKKGKAPPMRIVAEAETDDESQVVIAKPKRKRRTTTAKKPADRGPDVPDGDDFDNPGS
ncbi:mechanosensitive ion channel [Devosia algicola]|uniref:Mechanosensitive ion channel n=1 Tax=Devosia algicola TaxID=3026418 RepID=A0ABY7YLD4_9HYPH|nr:mechanosensitive ion channel domain-containing protein [Devosia algicola]WDR02073.1 mechanosensitive ion channel [Devosia algicola]